MKISIYLFYVIFVNILIIQCYNTANAVRHYTKGKRLKLREVVREMFQHAYDGYLQYASDYDELRPLSCDGTDTWGSYSLTLIDSLSTLATMGNFTEFRRVANMLESKMDFDKDINVSVFETNIRIVGGLLSAHLLSKKAGIDVEKGWPCVGPLLRLAEDMAKRLLPAFDTATGMPYGTVNLRYGVPKGETAVTCTATVGTVLVEFGTLSRLTGNRMYEEIALNALFALWERRSQLGLFGNHIDVQIGRWTALDSGIGAGVDSFFEYLVKGAILLNRPDLLQMFHEARSAIDKYMKLDDWYVWVGMNKGQLTLPVFQSLEAFWPGILSTIGDTSSALRTFARYSSVWKKYGFLPEFYNIATGQVSANRESYPLRPELAESAMYLYRATGNEYLLEIGEDMIQSIQFSARTKCGFSTIRNVLTHEKENRMESFFLSETTKYLYLLFDEDNFLHNDASSGEMFETSHGECVINSGPYIFNTEAHPIDMSALWCCHDIQEDIFDNFNVKQFHESAILKRSHEKRLKEAELNPKYQCGDKRPWRMFEKYNQNQTKENQEQAPLSVDIEVFDDKNQPAADVLVKNFERIRNEYSVQRAHMPKKTADNEIIENTHEQSLYRNQLTVTDLEEFFGMQSMEKTPEEVWEITINFMKNYTLDSGYIKGLNVFDKNISNILGSLVQKEFESHTRSLWELYALQQIYLVNVGLVEDLQILNFDQENNNSLDLILQALDYSDHDVEVENSNNNNINNDNDNYNNNDINNNEINNNNNNMQFMNIWRKFVHARNKYEFSLVNLKAMHTFLEKLYINGTTNRNIIIKPLLADEHYNSIKPKKMKFELNRSLFAETRKVIEVRKRMIATFQKLQQLIDDGNVKPQITLQQQKLKTVTSSQRKNDNADDNDADDDLIVAHNRVHDKNDAVTIENEMDESVADAAQNVEHMEKNIGMSRNLKKENINNSIWAQLVQTILRKTTIPKENFDEQLLWEKVQKSLLKYNKTVMNYELFSCQKQGFIGNFAYREFHP